MRSHKRILFIENPPFVGGSITGLYDLVRRLDCNRFEPIMLFCGPNGYRDNFRQLGIRVETLSERIGKTGRATRDITSSLSRHNRTAGRIYWLLRDLYKFAHRDYPIARRVAALIREWDIDLVHQNNCLRTDRATVLGACIARVPQVVQIRTLRPFSTVERYLVPSVDAFIYVSHAVEKLYRGLGIPVEKGHVIHDGFEPLQVDADLGDLRAQLGLTEHDFVIANVGRIEWWKGHEYFMQAVAEVVKQHPNTKALIVGKVEAAMRNQAYYNKVQRMVEELGLAKHVIFTGFRADVMEIMAMSDLIVHSSSEPEPFGRVIVEAMQVGRPVIATAAGGVLDIVENNVNGLMVPIKDAAAMAGAIKCVMQEPDVARRMGQRAQQGIGQRFSVERQMHKVQGLYEMVMAQ